MNPDIPHRMTQDEYEVKLNEITDKHLYEIRIARQRFDIAKKFGVGDRKMSVLIEAVESEVIKNLKQLLECNTRFLEMVFVKDAMLGEVQNRLNRCQEKLRHE